MNFEDCWAEALPCIKTLACSRVFDPDDREDLIQDTRIKAWSKFHTFNPKMSFRNWALRIFERSLIDLLRSRSRRIQACSLEAADEEFPGLEFGSGENVSQRVHDRVDAERVFAKLPDPVQALVLARLSGMTMAEISRATGIHHNTLATWRFRAVKDLEGAA